LFGQRHRRNLDRESAGLPDAALDVLDTLGEMAVTLREIAPRVDDADHRLAKKILARVAHLQGAGAGAERTQVGRAEPAPASEGTESLSGHGTLLVGRSSGSSGCCSEFRRTFRHETGTQAEECDQPRRQCATRQEIESCFEAPGGVLYPSDHI